MRSVSTALPTVETSVGRVEYADVGEGPVVVLLHGVHMNHTVWDPVVRQLSRTNRCVVPVLPLGGHRLPCDPDSDRTPRSIARLVVELLEVLDLHEVTLVGNDTGGALAQMSVAEDRSRIGRLVLASCDAFDNFPPGLPGRVSTLAARMPGGLWMAAQSMRWPALAALPLTWGRMTRRRIPLAMLKSWFEPLRDSAAVRDDVRRFLRAVDPTDTIWAADNLSSFEHPALVVWAADDRVMPVDHAHKLVAILPQATLRLVENSGTLLPLDQPDQLAQLIADFVSTDAETRRLQ